MDSIAPTCEFSNDLQIYDVSNFCKSCTKVYFESRVANIKVDKIEHQLCCAMSVLVSVILALLCATCEGNFEFPACENYIGFFGLEPLEVISLMKEIYDKSVHYHCEMEKLADALFINDTAIYKHIARVLLPHLKLEDIARRIYKQICNRSCNYFSLVKSAVERWNVKRIIKKKKNLSCSYAKNRRETLHKLACIFYS